MTINFDRIKGWFYRWCPQGPTRFDFSNSNLRYIHLFPWIHSEYANKILLMIIPFTLIIGVLNGFSSYIRIYLDSLGLRIADYSIHHMLISFSGGIIIPLIIFIIFYRFGKKINIELETKPIITYILLGCFIANFIGYLGVNIYFLNTIYATKSVLLNIFLSILNSLYGSISSTFTLFLVSFSAISLGSLRNYHKNNQSLSEFDKGESE